MTTENSSSLKSKSITDIRWTVRVGSQYRPEDDFDLDADVDPNNILGGETDLQQVLQLLGERKDLRLSHEQKLALQDSNLKTFEKAFSHWNSSVAKEARMEEDEEQIADYSQNRNLIKAWNERNACVNWLLTITFHIYVTMNFFYCLWKTYSIIVETAKFAELQFNDVYHCLQVVSDCHSFSHCINILHAISSVSVLHAKSRATAKLCWGFVIGCLIHSCFDVYEILYNFRFTYDDQIRPVSTFMNLDAQSQVIVASVSVLWQIPGIIAVLVRYYDLTQVFKSRANELSRQTYEGRQFNDKVIYKNVSSFVQRKYVLRSCTSFQIYNTVSKLQAAKKKLKRGEEIDEEVFEYEVNSAIKGLKGENLHL